MIVSTDTQISILIFIFALQQLQKIFRQTFIVILVNEVIFLLLFDDFS